MSVRGFEPGNDCLAAQMAATVAFADDASGASRIKLYSTARPATGAAPGGSPLVTIILSKPCGTISGGVLTLTPSANPLEVPLILIGGVPLWGRWERSDGVLVTDGSVSDMLGDGDFKIEGGTTEAGNDSPTLQAGGLVILGPLTFY